VGAADLLQTSRWSVVAITLALSARQNRHLARQTREAASQSNPRPQRAQPVLTARGFNRPGHPLSERLLTVDQTGAADLVPGATRGIPPATDENQPAVPVHVLRNGRA